MTTDSLRLAEVRHGCLFYEK